MTKILPYNDRVASTYGMTSDEISAKFNSRNVFGNGTQMGALSIKNQQMIYKIFRSGIDTSLSDSTIKKIILSPTAEKNLTHILTKCETEEEVLNHV